MPAVDPLRSLPRRAYAASVTARRRTPLELGRPAFFRWVMENNRLIRAGLESILRRHFQMDSADCGIARRHGKASLFGGARGKIVMVLGHNDAPSQRELSFVSRLPHC